MNPCVWMLCVFVMAHQYPWIWAYTFLCVCMHVWLQQQSNSLSLSLILGLSTGHWGGNSTETSVIWLANQNLFISTVTGTHLEGWRFIWAVLSLQSSQESHSWTRVSFPPSGWSEGKRALKAKSPSWICSTNLQHMSDKNIKSLLCSKKLTACKKNGYISAPETKIAFFQYSL